MKRKWIAIILSLAISAAPLLPAYAEEIVSAASEEAVTDWDAPADEISGQTGQEQAEPDAIEETEDDNAPTDLHEDAGDSLPDDSAQTDADDAFFQDVESASIDEESVTEVPSIDDESQSPPEDGADLDTTDSMEDIEDHEADSDADTSEIPTANSSEELSESEDSPVSAKDGAADTSSEPGVQQDIEETAPILTDSASTESVSTDAMNTQYVTGGTSRYSAKTVSVGLGSGTGVIDKCKVVTHADAVQKDYWYKFTTSGHDSFYTISFKNNSIDTSIKFYLLDSDESEVLQSYWIYKNNSGIEKLRLERYSTYYFHVYTDSGVGNFQFYVTEHYDDVKDDMYYAQRLNLGTRYVRGLQSWYDQDYFCFDTTSNNSFYAITFTNINISTYVTARIRTEDEEQLTYIDKYTNDRGTRYIKLRPNKTYYISVNEGGMNNHETNVGKYSITVTELKDDCASTKSSAQLFTRNKTRTGRINSDDSSSYPDTYTGEDEDWYKFRTGTITKNYFYVKNLNADGFIEAQVLDQYGEVIWDGYAYKSNEMRGNAILKRNSTYYLRIYGAKGNYKYRVSCRIPVTKVTLNKSSISLSHGQYYTLKATVYPSNASNKIVGWTSDDKSVATVSSSGRVYARSSGWATIYAITRDGGKRAACDVYVDW